MEEHWEITARGWGRGPWSSNWSDKGQPTSPSEQTEEASPSNPLGTASLPPEQAAAGKESPL